ncbi:MAG: hypothetical protein Q9222_001465 [Ikaeria aurantiellina]
MSNPFWLSSDSLMTHGGNAPPELEDFLPSRRPKRSIQEGERISNQKASPVTRPASVHRDSGNDPTVRNHKLHLAADAGFWDIPSSDDAGSGNGTGPIKERKRRKTNPPYLATVVTSKPPRANKTIKYGASSPKLMSSDLKVTPKNPSRPLSSSQKSSPPLQLPSFVASFGNAPSDIKVRKYDARPKSALHEAPEHKYKEATGNPWHVLYPVTKPANPPSSPQLAGVHPPGEEDPEFLKRCSARAECEEHVTPQTPRTPVSEKKPVKAATPRQQELWSMLLPKISDTLSPDRVDSPRNQPGHPSFAIHGPQFNQFSQPIQHRTKSIRLPSHTQRLIDKLQRVTEMSQALPNISHNGALSHNLHGQCTHDEAEMQTSDDKNIPQTPNSSCSPRQGSSQDFPLSNTSQRFLLGDGLKATYSSQRSYLANVGIDDAFSNDLPHSDNDLLPDDMTLGIQSGTQAPRRGLNSLENVPEADLEGPPSTVVRTLHELRQSGGNARHLNDLEALFDEIEKGDSISKSLRREKIFGLARKTQEAAYCRLLVDQGFDTRLLVLSTSMNHDAVTKSLLAVALLSLVAVPNGGKCALQVNDLRVAEFFASNLHLSQDVITAAQSRKSNISRIGKLELEDFFEQLSLSSVWRGGKPSGISCRLISLQGLEYLVRRRLEIGPQNETLPPMVIQRVVEALPSRHQILEGHEEAGLSCEIALIVSILEPCVVSGASQMWTDGMLESLITVLAFPIPNPRAETKEVRAMILRLLLNLTNNNPSACRACAKPEVIQTVLKIVEMHLQKMSEPALDEPNVLDLSILALGTLINLVEWSPVARDLICDNKETEQGPRQTIASHLVGGDLQLLLDSMEEFLEYHRQIEKELGHNDPVAPTQTLLVDRLESIVAKVRETE